MHTYEPIAGASSPGPQRRPAPFGNARDEAWVKQPAEAAFRPSPAPAAPQRLKDAFGKHDLYGDAAAPGEISWSSLPVALAEAWGRQGPSPQECVRAAASIDIPPHYPVSLADFKRLSEALKGRFEAERVEQKKDFDDQVTSRVDSQRVSFGTTKRAATIKEEPGVAKHDDATEPMMDPEIRSIRRLAMKQRYG